MQLLKKIKSIPIINQSFHNSRKKLASIWVNQVKKDIIKIGITGSYGKTSISYYLYSVLKNLDSTLMTDINLDTNFNLPITLLKIRDHKNVILEMGVDHVGDMDNYLKLVKPNISVINGINFVHSDEEHLGSIDNTIKEKRKIIEILTDSDLAFLNFDDTYVKEMPSYTKATVLSYGKDISYTFNYHNVKTGINTLSFLFNSEKFDLNNIKIRSKIMGNHNAANLTCVIGICLELGYKIEDIIKQVKTIEPLQGRLNFETNSKGLDILDDALRANPASTASGVEFFGNLESSKKKALVLGEMGELGINSKKEHLKIAKIIEKKNINLVICQGGDTSHISTYLKDSNIFLGQSYFTNKPQDTYKIIKDFDYSTMLLFLKGSRLKHMERIKLLLDGEKVNCDVLGCPLFVDCKNCKFRHSRYNNSA